MGTCGRSISTISCNWEDVWTSDKRTARLVRRNVSIRAELIFSRNMLIVSPEYQRRGLGRSLIQHCLGNRKTPNSPTLLVATFDGIPLYQSMEFKQIGQIHRLVSARPVASRSTSLYQKVIHLNQNDLQDVIRLDESAMGANREMFHQHRMPIAEFALGVRNERAVLESFGYGVDRGSLLSMVRLRAQASNMQ